MAELASKHADDGTSGERREGGDQTSVVANARLTGSTGAVLFVLFAAEGLTVLLHVRSTLSVHVFIGMLLIPPVALKIGATLYRFTRYYLGDPAFAHRGPPAVVLRLIGPFVVLSSVAVLVTGVAASWQPQPRWSVVAHKASFVAWFVLAAVHVLGHLRETPRLTLADWRRGSMGPRVAGRWARLGVLVSSFVIGVGLAAWSLSWQLPTPKG